MIETPPTLKPDEQETHVIAHDEVCFHANDLSRTEWVASGNQPLQQKGRGRIVHVSDFIIERTGRLCLTASEREAQMMLPCALKVEPTHTQPSEFGPAIETPPVTTPGTPTTHPTTANTRGDEAKVATTKRKKGVKKERKKEKKVKGTLPDEPSEPTGTSVKGRTFAENSNWDPNSSLAAGEGPYQLSSFDARRIIYPGANGDPWWDMPQLIAQVSVHPYPHG